MGLEALTTGRSIRGEIYRRIQAAPVNWADMLAWPIQSDQAQETYQMTGAVAQMREWVGNRQFAGLSVYPWTIENKWYENSVHIERLWMERDKTGQIRGRINDLVTRYRSHGVKLLADLLNNGASQLCYDGQYFFSTTHAEGSSGTLSNAVTLTMSGSPIPSDERGTTSAPSAKSMTWAISKLIEQLKTFKDDKGEPINEMATKFVAIVPTNMWGSGITSSIVPALAGGEVNPLPAVLKATGISLEMVESARLTTATDLFVMRVDGGDGTMPFIKQTETAPVVMAEAEGSSEWNKRRRALFGIDYRGAWGYGLWQCAVRGRFA